MIWANQQHSALYLCLHDTKKVVHINLITGEIQTEGEINSSTAAPWSIEPLSDTQMYVAGETESGQFSHDVKVDNHLLMGISAPGDYVSEHSNLPFAGELSLMVNHELAWTNGVRFYSVKIKNLTSGVTRSIIVTSYDMKWGALAALPRFMNTPTSVVGNLFPIRNPRDGWYSPYLAALIKTNTLDNGHNVLTVDIFDGNKQAVATAASLGSSTSTTPKATCHWNCLRVLGVREQV
ncbi:hypothetical protein F0U62_46990 [Cystobacter fuscus]|nr:hypothetical protein F0U62_46990 [Cystobacter fuscus]